MAAVQESSEIWHRSMDTISWNRQAPKTDSVFKSISWVCVLNRHSKISHAALLGTCTELIDRRTLRKANYLTIRTKILC